MKSADRERKQEAVFTQPPRQYLALMSVFMCSFRALTHLEVRVQDHDLLGGDEEVDFRGRLVLTLGRLKNVKRNVREP